jgi:hypothetical protein
MFMTNQIYKSIPAGDALGRSFYEIVPVKTAIRSAYTRAQNSEQNG